MGKELGGCKENIQRNKKVLEWKNELKELGEK